MATRTIRLLGAACIIGLVLVLALTPVLSAQRSATLSEPDTVRTLLREVQLLRTAIERAVLVNSRMQLSLLRLNVEQQRVGDLSGVLRSVQGELVTIAAMRAPATAAALISRRCRICDQQGHLGRSVVREWLGLTADAQHEPAGQVHLSR